MSKIADQVKKIVLENNIKGKVELNYNLSKLSWVGVAGKAEVFYIPDSSTELAIFLRLLPPFATFSSAHSTHRKLNIYF